jgi:hypothetical protein
MKYERDTPSWYSEGAGLSNWRIAHVLKRINHEWTRIHTNMREHYCGSRQCEMGFNLKGLKENDNRSTFALFEFFEVGFPLRFSWMQD